MTTMYDSFTAAPPSANEIEISLFGPGVGECIVIHIGNGSWIVVDSCRDSKTKRPIASEYLNRLNVSIHSAVRVVVVTHWHDDHIRGVADFYKEALKAKLVISGAFQRDEFLQLVSLEHSSGSPRGIQEMARLFRIADERKPSVAVRRRVNIKLAHENTTLLRITNPINVELTSLSPFSAATLLACQEIARLLPKYASPVNDIIQEANDVAVVLYLQAGNRSLLLGSDLETNNDPRLGWLAIVDSGERPRNRAEVYKVAHHGSISGHEPRIWSDLLVVRPHAILTPYKRLRNPLPTERDIDRIVSLTPYAFITATTREKEPAARSRTVDKIVKANVRKRIVREGTIGHIRLRANLVGDADWHVDLFNGAQRLSGAA